MNNNRENQTQLQQLVAEYKKGKIPVSALKQALQALSQSAPKSLRETSPESSQERSSPAELHALPQLPLSDGQKGVYFLQKLGASKTAAETTYETAYNVPLCIRLPAVNAASDKAHDKITHKALLEQAFVALLAQYPVLTSRIYEQDGKVWRSEMPTQQVDINLVDLSHLDAAEHIAAIRREAKFVFGFEHEPLYRITLFATADQGQLLLINFHHLIIDGISSFIVLKQLLANYHQLAQGTAPDLHPMCEPFDSVVQQEIQSREDGTLSTKLQHWKDYLQGFESSLELSVPDLSNSELSKSEESALARQHDVRTVSFAVDQAQSQAIKAAAKQAGVFPSAVFLAVYNYLLHTYSRQQDIIVGMPVNCRSGAKQAGLVGFLVNMAPIRSQYRSDNTTVAEYLKNLQNGMLAAVANNLPVGTLVRNTDLPVQDEKSAFFEAAFEYQNFIALASNMAGNAVQTSDVAGEPEFIEGVGQEGEYQVALEVIERASDYLLNLKIIGGQINQLSADTIAEHYRHAINALIGNLAAPFGDFDFVSGSDKHQLNQFNATETPYPAERCIHEFFLDHAAQSPDVIAVIDEHESLTYQQLHSKSRQLAGYLASRGVAANKIVGLCLDRSVRMMTGILSILQAGGAYLPLDASYPESRIRYMLQDSNAELVLTDSQRLDFVKSLGVPSDNIICIDHEDQFATEQLLDQHQSRATPDSLAYVIYTSGSTGNPKGVMNNHRAIVNRIHWMQEKYPINSSDRLLQKTPFSFDVSVWEFLWSMYAGAGTAFCKPEGHKDVDYLAQCIEQFNVTVLHFVPSMFALYLANADTQHPRIKTVFCSGEALDMTSAQRYRDVFPNALLANLYGPTEAAIDVSWYNCDELSHPFVPIGKPINNIL